MHRTGLIEISRRRLIQFSALALTNPLAMNLLDGRLYKGALKNICAPGLNCWSCPAAILACPIGAIQAIGVPFLSFRLISDVHDSREAAEAGYRDFWAQVADHSFSFLKLLTDKL